MKILYFAPIDWVSITQRPQHLSRRLSAQYEFFYIQPIGLRNLRLADFKRALNRLAGFFRRQAGEKLHVKDLIFIPAINPFINKMNLYILRRQLEPLSDKETIVWITSPFRIIPDLLEGLRYRALVYEMLDDYAQIHPHMEKDITLTETWLIRRADLVVATSSALFEKSKWMSDKNTLLVGNGVDYDFFARTTPERPTELYGMNNIAGYIGSVDRWLDLEAISFLAEKRKDITFVFVGPVKTHGLPTGENIRFLGKRDYEVIPHYCGSFDVCLIPFKAGEFADTINPVKLYEYFALGKPVVAFRTMELTTFGDLIYLAEDKEDFLLKLGQALSEDDTDVRLKRKEVARLNDWAVKAKLIESTLSRL